MILKNVGSLTLCQVIGRHLRNAHVLRKPEMLSLMQVSIKYGNLMYLVKNFYFANVQVHMEKSS